jgi:hypothetical protein
MGTPLTRPALAATSHSDPAVAGEESPQFKSEPTAEILPPRLRGQNDNC